jgi:hypothetical protein
MLGFNIATYQDTRDSIMKYREMGALRGVFLGFPLFDEKYTMSLPGCTDWTGKPQSGKSEFALEMLLNSSLYYNWKHLMYVPDIGKKEVVIAKLIHKLSGKTFDKRYVNSNYITEEEIDKHLNWVLEHFKIVTRTDTRQKMTPYEFWDWAVMIKKEEGLHTATIDSWKDMKRYVGRDGEPIHRDDLYLEDVLEYRNALSEEHNLHFHIIIHPLKTEKDTNGMYKPPHPYDLKGGTTWFDSGKCMITVHRVDGTYNEVRVIINKAKPETVASVGEVTFFYDKTISRFYWDNVGVKTYANHIKETPKALLISKEESMFKDDDDSGVPF